MAQRKSIFVSYRRSDADGYARLVHRQLSERFDPEIIYFDRHTPQAGEDFAAGIEAALDEASVVLVLIGSVWLDELIQRAMKGEFDFVRLEVERSLRRREQGGITVIPVLTGISKLPDAKELPEPIAQLLQALAKSQLLELYAGKLDASNFLFEGLITRLKGIPGLPEPTHRRAPEQAAAFEPGAQQPALNFVDVEGRLAELEAALLPGPDRTAERTRTVTVTGMAGVGKTELALQLALRHRAAFGGGVWLFAGQTAESLAAAATDACRACQIPMRPEHDTCLLLRSWLENTRQSWLIIIDNLSAPALAHPLVPRFGPHSVLITTRDLSQDGAIVLQPWSEATAAAYLADRLKGHKFRPQQADLRELARTLGGVPLALAHAAAYLNATGQPVKNYVDSLNDVDQAPALLGSVARHGPVLATLLTALERCEPAARHLLQTLACFADEPVPERWLRASAAARPAAEQWLVSDEIRWNEMLAQLRSLAMVERVGIYPADMVLREKAAGKRTQLCLQLNRLTQQALLASMPPDAEPRTVATQLLARAAQIELTVPARTVEYVCLATHLVFRGSLDTGPEAAVLLRTAAELHRAKGDFPAAYTCVEQWAQRAAELWGRQSWESVDATSLLAECVADLARPAEALSWTMQALQTASSLPATGGDVVPRAYAIHARCLVALGQPVQALQIYQAQVLDGYVLGEPDYVISRWLLHALGDMGQLLLATGRPEAALEVQTTILGLAEDEFGPWDATTLRCVDALARSWHLLGDHSLAVEMWQRVTQGRLATSGPLHPETIAAQSGLAEALLALGRLEEAVSVYDQALTAGNLTLSQDDPRLPALRDGLRSAQERRGGRAV